MASVESSSTPYHRASGGENKAFSEATDRTLHGTRVILKRAAVVIVYVLALLVGIVVLVLYAVVVLPPKR